MKSPIIAFTLALGLGLVPAALARNLALVKFVDIYHLYASTPGGSAHQQLSHSIVNRTVRGNGLLYMQTPRGHYAQTSGIRTSLL